MDDSKGDISSAGALGPAFYERLFADAGLAIFACDLHGRVLACSGDGEALWREHVDAPAAGSALRRLLPETDRATFEEHLAAMISGGEPTEFRTRLAQQSDVSEFAVWLTPMRGSGGALTGLAVWFHDITARLQIRRSMRKSERLGALGAMSGSVAHHYNNLLGAIAASLDYAMQMQTVPAIRRALARTSEAVTRCSALTQQLLAFARADWRHTDLADLTELVLYYADQNEARLTERKIALVVDCQPVPRLAVPREQTLIILANLTSNAIEAMPGGGTLTLRVAQDATGDVRLTVRDTGAGIAPQHMERLFEPFFTTKGELGDGTMHKSGMGLAVVHGFVHEIGGTISASNAEGGGAQFDIVLPVDATLRPKAEG
jgi:signal transduction histidine kinase